MIHMGASSNSTLLLAPTPLPHKGRLNNVKYEMAQLGINVLGKSETRRPGEGDYKSDGFRIIHSGEERQQEVAIILDKRTANCVRVTDC